MLSTIGVFMLMAGILIFVCEPVQERHGRRAAAPINPWDAPTLEWAIPSPPPEYNFAKLPTVHSLDPLWHQDGPKGHPIDVNGDGHGIHMPNPSYWPIVAALGMSLMMSRHDLRMGLRHHGARDVPRGRLLVGVRAGRLSAAARKGERRVRRSSGRGRVRPRRRRRSPLDEHGAQQPQARVLDVHRAPSACSSARSSPRISSTRARAWAGRRRTRS